MHPQMSAQNETLTRRQQGDGGDRRLHYNRQSAGRRRVTSAAIARLVTFTSFIT